MQTMHTPWQWLLFDTSGCLSTRMNMSNQVQSILQNFLTVADSLPSIMLDTYDWTTVWYVRLWGNCHYTERFLSNWLTDWLTDFMEQSLSWDDNSHSASQEVPRLLQNPNGSYCFHKGPTLVPVRSQFHPVKVSQSYFPKINSNIIFPCTPRSSEWSLQVFRQNFVYISHLSLVCYMACP